MKRGVTTWAEVSTIHESGRGRAQRKGRSQAFDDHSALIASRSGTIGTGLPQYADPNNPRLDPEYLEARAILIAHDRDKR